MNALRLITVLELTAQALRHLAQTVVTGLTPEGKLELARVPAGRITLHVVCAWRDHRFGWHWHGVARELRQR